MHTLDMCNAWVQCLRLNIHRPQGCWWTIMRICTKGPRSPTNWMAVRTQSDGRLNVASIHTTQSSFLIILLHNIKRYKVLIEVNPFHFVSSNSLNPTSLSNAIQWTHCVGASDPGQIQVSKRESGCPRASDLGANSIEAIWLIGDHQPSPWDRYHCTSSFACKDHTLMDMLSFTM